MLYRYLLLAVGVLAVCMSSIHCIYAQDDSFFIDVSSATVTEGATTSIAFSAATFDSIVSIQFSVNWDTAVIEYVDFNIEALDNISVGVNEVASGQLRFGWFSSDGLPQTEPDGTLLISINFLAVGETGNQSPVDITDTPLVRQVFRGLPQAGNFYEIDLLHQAGTVTIQPPNQIEVQLNSTGVSCFAGTDGSISLTTNADTTGLNFIVTNEEGSLVTPPYNNLPAGNYQLIVSDQNGSILFQGTTTITQPTNALSAEISSQVNAGCFTDGSILVEAGGGTPPYSYAAGAEINQDGNFSDLIAGSYSVFVTDINGCQTNIFATIGQDTLPAFDYGPTIRSLCGLDEINLGPSGSLQDLSFNWSTGSMEPEITVTEAGEYGITVTGSGGCISIGNYVVNSGSDLIEASILTESLSICPGDSLLVELSGAVTFQWLNGLEFLSQDQGPEVLAFPDDDFNFQVLAANSCGTTDTLIVPIEVFDILANAGPDTCVALGLPVQLSASGGIFYEWEENTSPVSNPLIGNPTVAPENTTTYRVLIEDINGCLTVDDVTVSIAQDPISAIPAINLITPNGDGDNDELIFDNITKFGQNTLRIYNRSGRLVYNKVNYQSDNERFAGNYLNEPLPEGTYYYVLEFRDGTIKQSLAILR